MTDGRIDSASIEGILSGGREQIDRYLVTCAIETRNTLDDLPESIAATVSDAISACRADSMPQRRRLSELWTAHERAQGMRSFWATLGKVLAAACALAGLIATFIALTPH